VELPPTAQGADGTGCPVAADCLNAGARCWYCVVATHGPTQYAKRDRKAPDHPATVAWREGRAQARREARRSEGTQRSRRSRSRGRHGEQVVAKELGGRRVPLSGALGGRLAGDVADAALLPAGWRVEVKTRARTPLYAWLAQGRPPADVLAVRSPGRPTLYVMDLAHLRGLRGDAPEPDLPAALRALADRLEARHRLEEV
jgi:hypothetical protein